MFVDLQQARAELDAFIKEIEARVMPKLGDPYPGPQPVQFNVTLSGYLGRGFVNVSPTPYEIFKARANEIYLGVRS